DVGVPELDVEHHEIDRTDGRRIVGHAHLGQMDRLWTACDGEAALAHGREMGTSRNEVDVGAGMRQPSAEISADPTRSHDRNSHAASSQMAARSLSVSRSAAFLKP